MPFTIWDARASVIVGNAAVIRATAASLSIVPAEIWPRTSRSAVTWAPFNAVAARSAPEATADSGSEVESIVASAGGSSAAWPQP